MRTLKQKKERAYEMGHLAGIFATKASQPYATLALAKEWLRGRKDGVEKRLAQLRELEETWKRI